MHCPVHMGNSMIFSGLVCVDWTGVHKTGTRLQTAYVMYIDVCGDVVVTFQTTYSNDVYVCTLHNCTQTRAAVVA